MDDFVYWLDWRVLLKSQVVKVQEDELSWVLDLRWKTSQVLVYNRSDPYIYELDLNLRVGFDLIGHNFSCNTTDARHNLDNSGITDLAEGLAHDFETLMHYLRGRGSCLLLDQRYHKLY